MNKNQEAITNLFKNVINQKARNAKQGPGSFLTIGFGVDLKYELTLRGKKEVKTRPEWLLSIYMCYWQIETENEILADNDDEREVIEEALKAIEGKKLLRVEVLSETYDTKFEFEGGVELLLLANNEDDENEQWKLFTPDKHVLVAGPNEKLSYGPSSTKT